MAITYPLAMPAGVPTRRIKFRMEDAVALTRSPYTGTSQTFVWPFNLWSAEVEFQAGMLRSQASALIAWLAALRGQEGAFLMGDPDGKLPQGDPGDTPPVCNGVSIGGSRLLTVRGFPNDRIGALRAGDYIQLGTGLSQRLYMNLQDVNSDASGHATLDIWPVLREATVDNQVVTVANTAGCWRLSDNAREWELDKAMRYGVTLSAVEAI